MLTMMSWEGEPDYLFSIMYIECLGCYDNILRGVEWAGMSVQMGTKPGGGVECTAYMRLRRVISNVQRAQRCLLGVWRVCIMHGSC